jgi:hypothetical protein
VFFIAYVLLITIVGCFLQVIFSDTVRNVFLLSEQNIVEGANGSSLVIFFLDSEINPLGYQTVLQEGVMLWGEGPEGPGV